MVNTEKLLAYVEAAGTTWEALTADIGGIPTDLQEFAETFEDDITANHITVIANACKIPSCQIGPVFFAPAWYDDEEKPHLDELEDPGDVILDLMRVMHELHKEDACELVRIFSTLGMRERHKLMSTAFAIEEKAGAAGRAVAE